VMLPAVLRDLPAAPLQRIQFTSRAGADIDTALGYYIRGVK
jgi:hypothetical protein